MDCYRTLFNVFFVVLQYFHHLINFLFLITEVCPKSKEMGDLMGVSACRLEAIEKNRRGEVKECCRDVFHDWLEQEGGRNYPVTWHGLCELLEDLQLSALAKQVQRFQI